MSTLNPAALLTMAHRGTGAFDSPREVATIAGHRQDVPMHPRAAVVWQEHGFLP